MSDILRITGMASGLDVDSMVKTMMKAENMKVDKLKQDQQIVQWKQDLFRDIMGDLNTFKSTYFDVLKPDNYLLSSRNYSSFDVASTLSSGVSTTAVTATAGSSAISGNYYIKVANLAEKANFIGTKTVNIEEAANFSAFPIKINNVNNILNIDGTAVTLTEKTYNNLTEFASEINSKMPDNLKNSVAAVVNGDTIRFDRKIAINDTDPGKNNIITVTVNINGTPQSCDVTLSKGEYTLSEITARINNKLVGTTLNGYKLETSDGTEITFKDKDGNVVTGASASYKDNATDVAIASADTPKFTTSFTNDGNETSFIGMNTNTLNFHKEILSGVNDTLSIKKGNLITSVSLADLLKNNDGTFADIDSMTGEQINDFLLDTNRNYNINNILGNQGITGITVSKASSGRLLFTSNSNDQISISGNGTASLGLSNGFSLDQTNDQRMSNLISGEVKFTVNNVTFHYDFSSDVDGGTSTDKIIGAKNKTIGDILSDIATKANVDISYSQLTRQFSLSSKNTGLDQMISNTQDLAVNGVNTNFLSTLFGQGKISDDSGFLYGVDGNIAVDAVTGAQRKLQGKDAQLQIKEPNSDYITVFKSTNSFTFDGVNYTVNQALGTDTEIKISLSANVQKTFDKIKDFVNKYNDIIDKINTKLIEKKNYSYKPLTDDQKKDMKDDDIKLWEEKAKQGLLANDSTLSNMLYKMRTAFYDAVKVSWSDSDGTSIGISLGDIGITTSSDVSQRGKLIIDETKLKNALQNNGDKVTQLFTKVSNFAPSYSPNLESNVRSNRYKEEGIFQRISDILQDNLRTLRDSNGKKGILLEKAGIKGDLSEFHNILTDDILDRDKAIKNLQDKLAGKENRYYIQFSKLEQAMQQMNSQSSWLSQQLGAMSR